MPDFANHGTAAGLDDLGEIVGHLMTKSGVGNQQEPGLAALGDDGAGCADGLVALSAPPRAGKPYFFCMSSGISSRRMASICHCGDPYQTESVPHMMWSAPIPLISVPINAAENLGCATAELANDVPSSAYTLVTPNLCGISARSLAHLMRPVDSNSAQARSGNSRNGRSAEW